MSESDRRSELGPVLDMRGIVKDFPGVRALDHVNLDLERGEIHALVGENGAGKSTLIKVLTGVYSCDEGEIWIQGKPVKIRSPRQTQQLGVACIYQELNLVPRFDVAQNIFLGAEPVGKLGLVRWPQMYEEAARLLDTLGASIDVHTPVHKLGVGQRQMVTITRALLHKPAIFVLDEPTAMLTRAEIHYLFKLLKRLKEQGVGTLYISHRMEEVFEIADRITVMRDGRNVGTLDARQTDTDQIVSLMVGRQLDDMYPKKNVALGSELFQVRGLGDGILIKDITFSVRQGEILGIYGVIGSGTTELAQMLVGDRAATQGEILVDGQRVAFRSPHQALRAGVALIPKDRREEGLILSLSVKENMTLASLQRWTRGGLIRSRAEDEAARQQISALGIRTYSPAQVARELSGGNQQKVVISKAMLSQARVFVFDEPTRGVDVGAKAEIYRLIGELLEGGATVVMFSSELPEILHIADRAIVMFRGRAVLNKPTAETNADEMLLYALKGTGGEEA